MSDDDEDDCLAMIAGMGDPKAQAPVAHPTAASSPTEAQIEAAKTETEAPGTGNAKPVKSETMKSETMNTETVNTEMMKAVNDPTQLKAEVATAEGTGSQTAAAEEDSDNDDDTMALVAEAEAKTPMDPFKMIQWYYASTKTKTTEGPATLDDLRDLWDAGVRALGTRYCRTCCLVLGQVPENWKVVHCRLQSAYAVFVPVPRLAAQHGSSSTRMQDLHPPRPPHAECGQYTKKFVRRLIFAHKFPGLQPVQGGGVRTNFLVY